MAVVVAVPLGVAVLLRSRPSDASTATGPALLDMHMYDATDGWAWASGDQILRTTSGVRHWTIEPPPIGNRAIVEVAWVDAKTARILTTAGQQGTATMRRSST